MFKNYFKVSIRNLIFQKGYTLINIVGLAIGIASTLFIILFVADELSYDKFHPNAKNIYRVCLDVKIQDTEMVAPLSNAPIAPTAVEEYPDFVNYTRVFNFAGSPDIGYNERVFAEKNLIYVDSTFFQVFSGFKLIHGNPDRVLQLPNQVVLTESTARKYFGNENPIGKMLKVWEGSVTWEVIGIVEDIPRNSHLQFDLAVSFVTLPKQAQSITWMNNNYYAYLELKHGTEKTLADKHLADLVMKYVNTQFIEATGSSMEDLAKTGFRWNYFLQPLQEIHLKSNMPYDLHQGGSLIMVYVFMIIAVLILTLAAINFMNLATARSAKRAKEVGIRKVSGSTKGNLMGQFLSESMLVTTISLILALGIVVLGIPFFNIITNKSIVLSSLPIGITIVTLLAIVVVVGIAAGSYPAFFLASFKPIEVLKGKLSTGLKSGILRHILVVVQFTITIGLVIAALTVHRQTTLISNKDLGYSPSQVMVIERLYTVDRIQGFIEEVKKMPQVEAVSRASSLPATLISNTAMQEEGVPSDYFHSNYCMYAHNDFDKVLKFKMIEGRYFDEAFASDTAAMVLNRTAAREFNFDGSPIGKTIIIEGWDKRTIIGVMEDFHFESLHNNIGPLAIAYEKSHTYLTIRLKEGDNQSAVKSIQNLWASFSNNMEMDYFFLEDAVAKQYDNDKRAQVLFTVFSILAVVIGGLGMLGLSSYIAEQRTHEVGVRKVMGASIGSVVGLMFKEITKLVVISSAIAWPIAWYFMNQWLSGFAVRASLSLWIFIGASFLGYFLGTLAVSYQISRLAKVNPAITLKME
ncbi:MAG: ABC transporter permease [Bacteroidales bacterium]|jgi:putative ABC transport system permease protein|nr:ABC transporter permease [Bacteroidales bacterium]MDD3701971.1 ABC transporter permease [Bacteroidales bacterium]MDY0368961.1 ABC transporter permease [Bacteroidales bacterium]